MTLVDPIVTRHKLQNDLAMWRANSAHRERGWHLISYDESIPVLELAFLGRITISSGSAPLPVVVCTIRLAYDNYDLWPPSLTFIDVFSGQAIKPHTRAFVSTPEGPRDVLIDGHPETKRPFLCLPGIREYHTHPQHSGDDWLLHRSSHEGSISTICDRVWRLMVRNIIGLEVSMQALPAWPLKAQIALQLAQGDILDATAPGRPAPGAPPLL